MSVVAEKPVALITGAGKGIGRALALALFEDGFRLALNARTTEHLETLATELAAPEDILLYPGSVADAQTVQDMVEATCRRFGRIDLLINNAGVCSPFVLLQEMSPETMNALIDINLKGPMFAMHAVIPRMVHQGGGTILNLNSMAGLHPYAYSSVYCASKYGLKALSRCVAQEQAQNNIKIVNLYPGEVDTPMWQDIEPGRTQDPARMLAVANLVAAVRYVLAQPSNSWVSDITLRPLHAQVH